MKRCVVQILVAVVAVALLPIVATAKFHQMKIVEVFPGSSADPTAQYVMLQMYADGQNFVTGHQMSFYDGAGSISTLFFTGTLPVGATQAYVLIATTDAQTLFGITADLVMPPVLSLAGGKVCFEDIDCFAWGNFASSVLNPSPSGTAFAAFGGLTDGHALQRDISAGNPALLEKTDDTNDSAADFNCVATADPTNNLGAVSTPYTDANPCPVCGDNSQDTGEQCDGADDAACVGACQVDCRCPSHDAVVFAAKALKVKVTDGDPAVTKTFKVKVRNVDQELTSDIIQLGLTHNCPLGVTVSNPDFLPPTMVDTVTLAAGKKAKAVVTVTANPVFTVASAKAPVRCTITFTATTSVAGNIDPQPSNNVAVTEVNVFETEDIVPATHETVIESARPATGKIKAEFATGTKVIKPALINADLPPDTDSIMLSSTTCPGVTIASLDMDPDTAGDQASINVDGGKKKKGVVTLSLDSLLISTPNKLSPSRCILDLEATGPSGPDPMPPNNVTQLVIDVSDKNDQ